jgi:hypothetical protein
MNLKEGITKNNKGQVTIFIIIAIVIIGGVVVFFAVRDTSTSMEIPTSIEPVYNTFLTCLEEDVSTGINILESQAGYIELPEFEPGSRFMPFSSQLDFLGNPVPYWYYVSGNNIQKEQIPSKKDMGEHLEEFIEEKVKNCRFDNYHEEGFEISLGESKADLEINDDNVLLNLDMDLTVIKGEESILIRDHELSIDSKLGSLYDSARKVYEHEQETLFLENYGVDNLRLYAPVDGVELSCSPLVWNTNEVLDELQEAIQENTLALRAGRKSSASEESKYFVNDLSVSGDVRFLNSRDWPYTFDVNPSEGNLLMAKPVGNQPGLGILGFCYAPYHFVYDAKYPVLVQVFDEEEIFQFPLAVVIQGNNPREALDVFAVEPELSELCEQKNTEIQVKTYDSKLNSINAEISYECFGTRCDIGETSSGLLNEKFPQCINGNIIARAEGFKDTKSQFSTVEPGVAEVVMEKVYEINVDLKLDGESYNQNAIISFISDEGTKTIVYPQRKNVELSEGEYEVQTHIYRNSSITLGATTKEQCIDVPQSGLGGFFGFTKEKCFNIEFPAQIVSSSLSGGGKQNYFILESQLISSNTIEINAPSLPSPETIEQLESNYILFEEKNLAINFR